MIPEFDENGNLPPGVYLATIDEIEAKFGRESEVRRAGMQSLMWLLDLVRRDDVRRLVINGSFVTDKIEPDDVDCVLLVGPEFGKRGVPRKEWEDGLPFLHLELADPIGFDDYTGRIFARDEYAAKGMLEVRYDAHQRRRRSEHCPENRNSGSELRED